MKVCVVGYGAMGKLIAGMLKDNLACVVAMECEAKSLNQTNGEFDVILDFSNPANLDMIYDYAKMHHKAVVFATTGYSDEQIAKINDLSKYTPVLRSANFSLGVILINRLIQQITPILKDSFDIEIIEAHHHNKVDAPSGTAKMLLSSAVDATGFTPVYGREGYCPRNPKEIGVHAVRGGSIVGEHEVLYCGEDEVISLKHSAHSKKIFAVGSIRAAKWLVGKSNGMYNMEDVLFGGNE